MALTRYACCDPIAQDGEPRQGTIAFAMTSFAVKTRRQESIEARIAEWERLQARETLTLSQKALADVFYGRGVGDQGLARILSQGDAAQFEGAAVRARRPTSSRP
ncbi:MAG: hypothetical protein LBM75_03310 [Myxococcales bacterium]|jgi:DNA-damage-inducible protein D|nr:hypothetical protein [Myxococcales bacterium]